LPLYPALPIIAPVPSSRDRRPTPAERQLAMSLERDALSAKHARGGIIRAEKKRYAAWKAWRQKALKECKKMLREDPAVKRAKVLQRLQKMNRNLSMRTLERTVDGWKERAQGLSKIVTSLATWCG
jgi:hypothetical protein